MGHYYYLYFQTLLYHSYFPLHSCYSWDTAFSVMMKTVSTSGLNNVAFLSLVTQKHVQNNLRPTGSFYSAWEPGICSFLLQAGPGSCASRFCSHPIGQHYVTWLHLTARKPGKCSLRGGCQLFICKGRIYIAGQLTISTILPCS